MQANRVSVRLLNQLEERLNGYKVLIVQLRSFSDSDAMFKQLLVDCEFEINKIEHLLNKLNN